MEKILKSTPKSFHRPHFQNNPTSLLSPEFTKLSRRQLAISTKSSLLLLFTSQFHPLFPLFKPTPATAAEKEEENLNAVKQNPVETNTITTNTFAENPVETTTITIKTVPENPVEAKTITTETVQENPVEAKTITTKTVQENASESKTITTTTGATDDCSNKVVTKQAFLDVSVDGQPIGRIIIGLYGNNVPAGATRLGDFISGAAGISYRRKEFVKITSGYVQHGGVRSYGVDAELAAKTGRKLAVDNLIDEWERENGRCPGVKNVAGSVGIVVRDPLKPPPKQKLVARGGKLEIDEEEVGKDPNGSEFVISTKDSPELDASTLVVGKVLDGMEVVQRIGQVKTVQENTSSPYFRVAKLIGDKRAMVAERGFNRPYSKVVVTNCGLMA